MKLSKKEKEKLIGKKIVVETILEKENVITNYHGGLREITTVTLTTPIKAIIIGFTYLCEGKMDYIGIEEGSSFTCTKRIPCIKIATGITGRKKYAPMSVLEGKKKQ